MNIDHRLLMASRIMEAFGMSNGINIFNLNHANRICDSHISIKHKHYDLLMYVVLDILQK